MPPAQFSCARNLEASLGPFVSLHLWHLSFTFLPTRPRTRRAGLRYRQKSLASQRLATLTCHKARLSRQATSRPAHSNTHPSSRDHSSPQGSLRSTPNMSQLTEHPSSPTTIRRLSLPNSVESTHSRTSPSSDRAPKQPTNQHASSVQRHSSNRRTSSWHLTSYLLHPLPTGRWTHSWLSHQSLEVDYHLPMHPHHLSVSCQPPPL